MSPFVTRPSRPVPETLAGSTPLSAPRRRTEGACPPSPFGCTGVGPAAIGFAGVLWAVADGLGNDGLWLAFAVFLLLRGGGQAMLLSGLVRRGFA